jgi:hypothetical protein
MVAKPALAWPFLHSYFNDVLLIACALPPVLWVHRKLGLRVHDRPPTRGEIGLHVLVWSVVCELVGPRFKWGIGDGRDIIAYVAGAVVADAIWRGRYRSEESVRGRGGYA